MNGRRAFTLIELLITITVIAIIASLAVPGMAKAKSKVRSIQCINNLKQWGLGVQLYAADHDDYLPEEGTAAPGIGVLRIGWYVTLPRELGLPPYYEMAWRTNADLPLPRSIFLCPANSRRATNNNLFHYCLNEHVDGTGTRDRPIKVGSISAPAQLVYLFDNGRRAAVAQQNNVHTNLHANGAHFLFVDGHSAHFRNIAYWNFTGNRGRTNNPDLLWIP
jgi:prepilin-type N-terminal cleavage/methylation domain-containing protein/prepilin-type processing-associated H-X9-DG protein